MNIDCMVWLTLNAMYALLNMRFNGKLTKELGNQNGGGGREKKGKLKKRKAGKGQKK